MTSWNFHEVPVCHVIHRWLAEAQIGPRLQRYPPLETSFDRLAGLTTRALVGSSAPALLDDK
ncbi:uncharacterized protein LY79DRAFT_573231 [Colletotrichum navitas]|uniref:Uncharacterized protein n=1 Tax=Colletotrichum navitas TaxID=681940 RepID=A0AAD8PJC0_9PEZI|nr:uncharacterized protein LY79DRAFT_573231 [Colletotrichum navitas]KAK1565875.1 hypothetical protein LY79DRAFT_573231 [Colletotrichum navitas]